LNHPNVDRGSKYVRDVIGGKIPVCKWIVLACQRHLDDLKKSKQDSFHFYFDPMAAEKTLKFKQLFPHTKGKWAAKKELLILEPWQCFFNMCVFGWKRKKDDTRRYRRALLFVPRKNGKSAEAATTGLYMLAADKEYGAEVYSGATSEKQSWEVFRPAKQMAEKVPDFLEFYGVEVFKSNIHIEDNGSRFEPVIGKPGDGSSPHCAIVDEYHEHKTDELVDTMETGMGAREQPLLLVITTAGDNIGGPCYQMQLDLQKTLDGVMEDDQTFGLIYTIDKDDDWADPKTLIKANPNYGVSVSEDFLLAKLQEAKNNSRKQGVFQTKHLNIWVGSRDAYFNVQRWKESADLSLKLEDFKGKECYMGLDLASKVDIAALNLLFPLGTDQYAVFNKFYIPEAQVESSQNEHYQGWARDGYLTVTDGEIIDFNYIKEDILHFSSLYGIKEIAYDPHQATMLVTELMGEGVPVVEMRQTVLNFSEPMKYVDSLIRSRQIQHDGNPVMTWMLSNVTAKEDAKENVYPRKERPENKIDGPVALIMAMGRAMNDNMVSIDQFINDPIGARL